MTEIRIGLVVVAALSLAPLRSAWSAEKTFKVTVDSVVHGTVQLEPPLPENHRYPEGTVVTVTATPGDGYAIDSVYYSIPGMWGAAYQETTETSFEVVIVRDKHVGASFIAAEQIDHVNVINNVVYAQPGMKPLKYDVYSPKGADGLPIIVIIHGGGWASNDEDIMRGLARELTKGGRFVVCSIDYRWMGKGDGDETPNRMADIIEDVFGAIAHIMEHANAYGGDAKRIGITGDSAGGHLSATAALMPHKIGKGGFGVTSGVYEYKPTYLPNGKSVDDVRQELMLSIKAAAPSYGVFSAGALGRFLKQPKEIAAGISPQSHVPSADDRAVPQYLLRGTNDFLIPDGEVTGFVEALQSKGQLAMYEQVPEAGHAFFDWKPNAQVKATFEKYGVPYAAKMRKFFETELYGE